MSKRSVLFKALFVGLILAVARVVYLQVSTSGMSEYAFTVTYGSDWRTMLPVSVISWFVFGFLLWVSVEFFRGSKSFTEKI